MVRHVALALRTLTGKKPSLCISITVRIRGREVKATALLDSSAEVNLIYLRLLRPYDFDRLNNHVAVSTLFNGSTNAIGSRDFLVKV